MAERNVTVVQCVNGHHFNADKYEECPICHAAPKATETAKPEGKKNKIFDNVKKKEKEADKEKQPDKKMVDEMNDIYDPPHAVENNGTFGFFVDKSKSKEENDPSYYDPDSTPSPATDTGNVTGTGSGNAKGTDTGNVTRTGTGNVTGTDTGNATDIGAEVNNAKTHGFFRRVGSDSTNADRSVNTADTEDVILPMGWLVCVKGLEFGKAFPIRSGQNTIGRSPERSIPLLRDTFVSRGIHAKIKFEPIKKKFTLISGDTEGLTYLNGEDIDAACELKAYDMISLSNGGTDANAYMFVPLCGENFSWEDYMEQE